MPKLRQSSTQCRPCLILPTAPMATAGGAITGKAYVPPIEPMFEMENVEPWNKYCGNKYCFYKCNLRSLSFGIACTVLSKKVKAKKTPTELAKTVCPRLRDIATAPAGGITQPRTHFFGQLCDICGKGCVFQPRLLGRLRPREAGSSNLAY